MACNSCGGCGGCAAVSPCSSCSAVSPYAESSVCNGCKDPITYKIGWRDTYYCLAIRYDTSVECLQAVNPGIDPLNLQIGSKINICRGSNDPAHTAPEESGCGCNCCGGCGGCGSCGGCGCS
ncbi:MAG: LysM domain-containing protein [Ruminococcus sp.]|nr:LysM domain-containing protein [Ruminococcus sp.]